MELKIKLKMESKMDLFLFWVEKLAINRFDYK